jgi:hypothetical protein
MSQPQWIKITDELPPIGEWVWFRCCDLDGGDWHYPAEVGCRKGQDGTNVAVQMDTLPDDYQRDVAPCTEWTRADVVDGMTVAEKIEQNKREMVEYKQ